MGVRGYVILFFVSAWMFFLGILVGRGTAPVSFDTTGFQAALARLALESKVAPVLPEAADLDFYDVLKKPAPTGKGRRITALDGEILPAARRKSIKGRTTASGLEIKLSRKAMTRRVASDGSKKTELKSSRQSALLSSALSSSGAGKSLSPAQGPEPHSVSPLAADPPASARAASRGGADSGAVYTIQVAAFRALEDVLKKKEEIEAKGYTCYRTMAKKDNTIWHRLRIGSFKTRKEARRVLERLRADHMQGMIIQKDGT